MQNKEWPTITDLPKTKQLVKKSKIFRSTIKFQESANKIFSQNWNWELKEINLRTLWNTNFTEYVKNEDLWRTKDSSKFYKILQSLIKYKSKGKLLKGINEDDTILYWKLRDKRVKEHFQAAFKDDLPEAKINNNGIFDYTINIDEAIRRIAINKAVGRDYIPGEMHKIDQNSKELKPRQRKLFVSYLETG